MQHIRNKKIVQKTDFQTIQPFSSTSLSVRDMSTIERNNCLLKQSELKKTLYTNESKNHFFEDLISTLTKF